VSVRIDGDLTCGGDRGQSKPQGFFVFVLFGADGACLFLEKKKMLEKHGQEKRKGWKKKKTCVPKLFNVVARMVAVMVSSSAMISCALTKITRAVSMAPRCTADIARALTGGGGGKRGKEGEERRDRFRKEKDLKKRSI